MSRPLQRVRVLDATTGWARGTADLLADLGADVVRPGSVEALVPEADVVVEDGTLDPARLLARHPRLVVVSVTDFGRTGPRSRWRGSEGVLAAMGGVLSRSGVPGREPLLPPAGLVHGTACVHAAWAALLGLAKALQTGEGELVDVSALEAVVHGFDPGFGTQGTAAAGRGEGFPRGRPDAADFYPVFDCLDGQVRLCLLAPRQWRAMFAWLGEPEEFADPRFDSIPARFAAAGRLHPLIAALVAGGRREELAEEAAARGIPLAPVISAQEVLTAEHFARTGALQAGEPAGYLSIDGVRAHATRARLETWADREAPPSPPKAGGRRPLEGVRVLDLGVIVFGAELGRLLGDQGAEVIKVESLDFPDGLRQSRRGAGISASFAWGQRNKKGLGLDLRSGRGRELLLDLVREADVVLSNWKPGTLESLGLTHAELAAVNPAIITTESSAFGAGGPWSRRMGYGPLVRAACGVTASWTYPDGTGPCDGSTVYPDHVAAHVSAVGVLACLLGGDGAQITTAQCDVALVQLLQPLAAETSAVLACAGDDEWIVVTGADEDLAAWASTLAPLEASELLQARGVAAGPMLRLPEELDDPQLLARASFAELTHPELEAPLPASARAAVFSTIPDALLEPAPRLGEHTRALAARLLHLSEDEVEALVSAGVLQPG